MTGNLFYRYGKKFHQHTLIDCTNVKSKIRMLTLLLSSLISLAALNNRRKPILPKTPVASMILPTTVIKSNVFQASLKQACKQQIIYQTTKIKKNNLKLRLYFLSNSFGEYIFQKQKQRILSFIYLGAKRSNLHHAFDGE